MLSYKSLSIATVLLFLRGSLAATCGTRTTSELQGFDTLQSEQRYWYLRDKLCGDNGAGCESSNSCEVRLDRSGNSLTLTRSGTDKKTQDCYDATVCYFSHTANVRLLLTVSRRTSFNSAYEMGRRSRESGPTTTSPSPMR